MNAFNFKIWHTVLLNDWYSAAIPRLHIEIWSNHDKSRYAIAIPLPLLWWWLFYFFVSVMAVMAYELEVVVNNDMLFSSIKTLKI